MSAFWFGRLSRSTPVNDIRPGNRYRRQLGSCLAATATVLDLRSDLVGIQHVQFAVAVDGSVARLSEGDTRVLALQSFLETYREPLAQEAEPDANGLEGVTVIRLLPRPLQEKTGRDMPKALRAR
jgi:hypothetical protein